MAKIGRNDPCPCGSGKKYKNCCAGKGGPEATEGAPAPAGQVTLQGEIGKVQATAGEKRASMWTLGVFIFFSTREGDGWVLDASAMDALQVASGGRAIDVEVTQTAESIEITWSHMFNVDRDFRATPYGAKDSTVHADYPASRIRALIGKIRDSLTPELRASLHLS